MTKVMNKDLFDDPKDYKIARLKETIEAFKKYDSERKQYYKEVIEENTWLKEELELNKDTEKFRKRLHDLSIAIARKNLELNGITDEQIEKWKSDITYLQFKEENSKLRKEIKELRKTVSDLTTKLARANK